ncbi:flavodoxin domain-containing protein [Cellulomonas sp. URHE0023]|uniref:flavodoxin domain-containing protein n=1 Tax=Cellulomonas sp. URHE0023 TaxID=1380354 RepID=UPI000487DE2B|nr:flavodoxin domain-containing protein [Cellulomonas sp. URHE0023]
MTRVLVAYGTTRGGTEGVARMIGDDLREHGHEAVVRPAAEVHGVADVDAVVVVGALYAGRWHKDARRFVHRHERELSQRPVWLVATGPLDGSAATEQIAPVGHVRAAAHRIGARGTQTFGGRLLADATGFPASAMAKSSAGDWRDAEQIARWVGMLEAHLTS